MQSSDDCRPATPPPLLAQQDPADGPQHNVPSLEPPLPIAARLNGKVLRRRWLVERWQETPSWLTSLVLHLTVIVMLGSLITAVNRNASPMRWITLSLADVRDEERMISAEIELTDDPLTEPEGGDQGEATESPSATTPDTADDEPAEQPLEAATTDEPQEDRVPETDARDPVPQEVAGADDASPHAEETVPIDPSGQQPMVIRTALALNRMGSADSPAAPTANPARQLPASLSVRGPADEIVDQFILYDIGRLSGEAGQRARREFNRLGPRAIPALVRGLNRSAGIQASCPVGVISYKLEKVTQESTDRNMLAYAIENIGWDVAPDAPHYNRIMQVRERIIIRSRGETEGMQRVLANEGLPSDLEMAQAVIANKNAPPDQLAANLNSDDVVARQAVSVALTVYPTKRMATFDRLRLGHQLTERLAEGDEFAGRAMVVLAAGSRRRPDIAGMNDAGPDRWRQWWSQYERLLVEPRTQSLVAMAQALEGQGRANAALERYERIAAQFPGTPAAELAQERADALRAK